MRDVPRGIPHIVYIVWCYLECCLYSGGNLGKLLGCEGLFRIAEEHVALLLQRNQVDMGVGHLHAQHSHADTLAGECGL